MLFGTGWCVLRTARDAYETASLGELDALDSLTKANDEKLWSDFRAWMAAHDSPWVRWTLFEQHNNHNGVLQFFISRNHRASPVWEMLQWIATNGPSSFGLLYVHDDEDVVDTSQYGRGISEDFDNVFRVHRILRGVVTEHSDPFFGPIVPNLDCVHPFDRDNKHDSER
jgi:hypothetical protein